VENAALRHQLVVLQRSVRGRIEFTNGERLFFVLLYQWFPSVIKAMVIVRPETVVRWHRAGFRRYWRWKSKRRQGRPGVAAEIRQLIQEMSVANPLWGAPRIHGELLKLGIDIGQTSVANTWREGGRRHPRAGGRSYATTRMGLRRWAYLSFRPRPFGCCMGC